MNLPAEAYHNFPLAPRDRTWDVNEATPRLRRWASRDGSGDKEQIDWNKLRKVYFWHEAGELTNFGQLKLPYCDIIDGEPHVVHNAVQNALARIDGSSIPNEDKPAVRSVAERQMRRFQDSGNTESMEADGDEALSRTPAVFGSPNESQLAKINALAKRSFSPEEVFVFRSKAIGNGLIPTRFAMAHKSLLEVFQADAQKGIAFMLDHPWAGMFSRPKPALSYGRSFDAVLKHPGRNEVKAPNETLALYIDHYIPYGREKDGISTDQIINDIQDGVLFDTSVGFGNDVDECSICGGNLWGANACEHWPGREYEGQTCYSIMKPPGYLMENSGVFDGAYPGAGILSNVNDGMQGDEKLVLVENLKELDTGTTVYRIYSAKRGALLTYAPKGAIKTKTGLYAVGGVPGKEESKKVELKEQVFAAVLAKTGLAETVEMTAEQVMAVLAEKFTEEVKLTIQESAEPLKFALTEPDIRRALGLTEQADQPIPENWSAKIIQFSQEGRESRQELINDTLEWGVRAYGNDFAMESYREILSEPNRTVQAIKDMREQFKKKAGEDLQAGRVTKIQTDKKPQATIPAEAFKI